MKRAKKLKYIIYKIGTKDDGEFNGKVFPKKESTNGDYDTFIAVLPAVFRSLTVGTR
jgi:hypothetical protein